MRYHEVMRTTLELADDVLDAARALARQQGATLGQIVSELARRSLPPEASPVIRNGVPLFTPKRGAVQPDLALVNRIRDEG